MLAQAIDLVVLQTRSSAASWTPSSSGNGVWDAVPAIA